MTGVSSQESVHKALAHPTRVNVLLRMQEAGRLSPSAYSKGAGHSVSLATYHFGRLLAFGAIELVETHPRRGATEHVYAINQRSPIVRFLLAAEPPARERVRPEETDLASLLGGDRRRTGLCVIPVVVDPAGKAEVEAILEETKARLAAADAAARTRLNDGDEATTLHVAFTALS